MTKIRIDLEGIDVHELIGLPDEFFKSNAVSTLVKRVLEELDENHQVINLTTYRDRNGVEWEHDEDDLFVSNTEPAAILSLNDVLKLHGPLTQLLPYYVRDNSGDIWTMSADGTTYFLGGETRRLPEVNGAYGPLSVVDASEITAEYRDSFGMLWTRDEAGMFTSAEPGRSITCAYSVLLEEFGPLSKVEDDE